MLLLDLGGVVAKSNNDWAHVEQGTNTVIIVPALLTRFIALHQLCSPALLCLLVILK